MNSINEKEKKLNIALAELKNLDLTNPDLQNDIEKLNNQKNQLEIEKQELEEKYKKLLNDYNCSVSYTHLTLPTSVLVYISVVAV